MKSFRCKTPQDFIFICTVVLRSRIHTGKLKNNLFVGEKIMIAVLKQGTTDTQIENLSSWLKAQGLDVHLSKGKTHTVIGLVGDTAKEYSVW